MTFNETPKDQIPLKLNLPVLPIFTAEAYEVAIDKIQTMYPSLSNDKELPTYLQGLVYECQHLQPVIKKYAEGDTSEDLKEKLLKDLPFVLAYLTLIGECFAFDTFSLLQENIEQIQGKYLIDLTQRIS